LREIELVMKTDCERLQYQTVSITSEAGGNLELRATDAKFVKHRITVAPPHLGAASVLLMDHELADFIDRAVLNASIPFTPRAVARSFAKVGKLAATVMYANHNGLHGTSGYWLVIHLKDGRVLRGPIRMEFDQDANTLLLEHHEPNKPSREAYEPWCASSATEGGESLPTYEIATSNDAFWNAEPRRLRSVSSPKQTRTNS
jgi:hypothetical protein